MKKIKYLIFILLVIFILSGCEMGNTPTKKVENYLDNYKNLSTNVIEQLDDIINEDLLMNDNQRTIYKDILKKQYQDLTYEIKDEIIDGEKATVTVEIEVYDLYKKTKEAEDYLNSNPNEFADQDGNVLDMDFLEYKLNELTKQKERVTYTIDFTLTKINDTWVVDDLTDTERLKIHGLYEY